MQCDSNPQMDAVRLVTNANIPAAAQKDPKRFFVMQGSYNATKLKKKK